MPVLKVPWTMIGPVIIGGLVCANFSLVLLIKNIWNESFGTRSGTSDQYLLPKEPSRVGKLLRDIPCISRYYRRREFARYFIEISSAS